MLIFFFSILAFQISQKLVFWKIRSGNFSPSDLMHPKLSYKFDEYVLYIYMCVCMYK